MVYLGSPAKTKKHSPGTRRSFYGLAPRFGLREQLEDKHGVPKTKKKQQRMNSSKAKAPRLVWEKQMDNGLPSQQLINLEPGTVDWGVPVWAILFVRGRVP